MFVIIYVMIIFSYTSLSALDNSISDDEMSILSSADLTVEEVAMTSMLI